MTNMEIEKRIEILEAEVALLKSKAEKNGNAEKPWYKQIPNFGGNPAYREAMKLGGDRESQKDFENEK